LSDRRKMRIQPHINIAIVLVCALVVSFCATAAARSSDGASPHIESRLPDHLARDQSSGVVSSGTEESGIAAFTINKIMRALEDPISATLTAILVGGLLLGGFRWTRTPEDDGFNSAEPEPQATEKEQVATPCTTTEPDSEPAQLEDRPLPPPREGFEPASDALRTVQGLEGAADGCELTNGTMNRANDDNPRNGYTPVLCEEFPLRGKGYLDNKKKNKAEDCMFDLVGCDTFYAKERDTCVCDWDQSVLQRMKRNAARRGRTCPRVLAINWMVPGSPRINHVEYFVEKEFVPVTDDDKMYQRMIDHFFADGNDAFRTSRFKLIPHIEVGNFLVKKAVGKPTIVCKAIKTEYHVGDGYLEVAIDIGCSKIAERVLGVCTGFAKSLVIDLGYTIEGRKEEELPERLLCGLRIHYFDMKSVIEKPTGDYSAGAGEDNSAGAAADEALAAASPLEMLRKKLHSVWSGEDYESNKLQIQDTIQSSPVSNIRVITCGGVFTEDFVSSRVNVWLDEAGAVQRFSVG